METGTSTRFLVVGHDAVARMLVCAALGANHQVSEAVSLQAARRTIGESEWTGIILDLNLPDGDGIDLLRELRRDNDQVPVLVLTSHLDHARINEVQLHGAQLLCKPAARDNIRRFIAFALAHALLDDGDLSERLSAIAAHHHLTLREVEYVAHSARGVERGDLAVLLGISENTVKSQLRGLLAKVDARAYAELPRLLLIR